MDFPLPQTMSLLVLGTGITACSQQQPPKSEPPNIVLIFLDDAGWADFEPFAETRYPTPNVRDLAEAGTVYNNFYVPQAICSASRAALLTGAYPERVGLFGAHAPRQRGLDPDFATVGEILQNRGYQTASFGKWHVGDQAETRPPQRGFDESTGIMYSNDMWADHPTDPEYWGQYPLQYWENGTITIDSVTAEDQKNFTTWFTEDAVSFINQNRNEPFFLYVPHPMPHVPLFVSEKFEGQSGTGLYGDVIMELDWSVGQIMGALETNNLQDNTMIIFTSDNGPWLTYGNHAGKTPFRGEKATSFDGGVRAPLIITYPGEVPAGKWSHHTFNSIDLLPTLAYLTGAELPDNEIDGKNVWNLISGQPEAVNPHDYYAFTTGDQFEGVMSSDGQWKLHIPHEYRTPMQGGKDGIPGEYAFSQIDTALFDMIHDPYERVNVIDEYPEVANKLLEYVEQHQNKFFH